MNSRTKQSIIDAIKSSKLRNLIVQDEGSRITLTKLIGIQVVKVTLNISGEELWIDPPRYAYRCHTSHFDFSEGETRWTRRKGLILQIVNMLRSTGAWKYISNKSFFSINENFTGKKKERTEIAEQYQEALHGKITRAGRTVDGADGTGINLKARQEVLNRELEMLTSMYVHKTMAETEFKDLSKSIREELMEISQLMRKQAA